MLLPSILKAGGLWNIFQMFFLMIKILKFVSILFRLTLNILKFY